MAPVKPTVLLLLLSLLLLSYGALGGFEVAQAQTPPVQSPDDDPLADFYSWVGRVGNGTQEHYDPEVDTTALLDASASKKKPAPTTPKDLITVALDGSGDYKSVQDAVDAVPKGNKKRVTIHIKAGVYKYVLLKTCNFGNRLDQAAHS